jgi:hypothetical protein
MFKKIIQFVLAKKLINKILAKRAAKNGNHNV